MIDLPTPELAQLTKPATNALTPPTNPPQDRHGNIDIDFLREHLTDHRWRLNNLYSIRDKKGRKVQFKLNDVQQYVLDNLWYLSVITKGRQLGMCLDPDTRVLTADLQWVKIGEMKAGTEIVSVDEYPPSDKSRRSRRMRTGVVEGVVRFKRETYRISFEDGSSLICTGKHPWLAVNKTTDARWMTIDGTETERPVTIGSDKMMRGKVKNKLTIGCRVRKITEPWGNSTVEDGWLGGMLDGEGSLANSKHAGADIGISQVEGPVWERLIKYFKDNQYSYRIETDNKPERKSKFGVRPVMKISLSRMDEIFRLIGKTRPTRFLGRHWWENRELPYMGGNQWVKITDIEYLGEREVVDLQTSVGTYIAEGFVSHNTTFFTIFYLDQILFNDNKIAGIIAHKQEDMKRIFRGKILFALRELQPAIREMIGAPTVDTANELVFKNGGSIFVSLSSRSQTLNYLHISEFGYICAHDPAKADEIVHGSLNSVAPGQMVSIESTAEGREGHFYNIVQRAENARKRNEKLTPLDFKSFFFPWWMDHTYMLPDTAHVPLSKEDKEYFDSLQNQHGIYLTHEQKVWYIKKKQTNSDGMFKEYPSTLDEAFAVSLDGAYYAKEVARVYQEKRVGFFPHDPAYNVDVAWDLGMNDDNVLIFFQEIGEEIRIIDHYSDHGYGLAHYVKLLAEKPYRYGRHILPHDAAVRDLSLGISREAFLWSLGVRNTQVMPKASIQDGIEKVRMVFNRLRFHETQTSVVLDALQNYRKDFDKVYGVWKNSPRHGPESHIADAMRQLALAVSESGSSFMVDGKSPVHIETFSF